MIAGCDAAKNYMFLEIHTGVSGWIVIWGSSHAKIEQPDTYNIMG